ncbi:MAG: hypothetical protein ACT4QF_12255 [Sporichthyaceae bacterium]
MAPRPHTPPELLGAPFRLSDALAAGLTRHQLASKCWTRLFREVYVHDSVPITDRLRLDALRLIAPPDAVVVGVTAAWLHGVWTPRPGLAVPLQLGLPSHRGAFDVAEGRGRRVVLADDDVQELEGIPVTTPERTCFGLMAATTPTEAVVWADAFLHRKIATPLGLRSYLDEVPRRPYVRKCRAAVERARVGAASPMETRLRLVIVDGGLPEPDWLNKRLYDARGRFLGEPDMGWDPPDFGVEYDGAYHETATQRQADNRRENGLLIAGIPLLRYTRHDVYRAPQRIVHEVGAMLRGDHAA